MGSAAAVLSHNSFGVAVSPQVGRVDKEKSAQMDVVLPWGDFILGSCLWHRTLPWGGLRLGQKDHCSPWLEAICGEQDAGRAPSAGCLVLADDGMLGAGSLLLAEAMQFGMACDMGLGPGWPLCGLGSCMVVSCAAVAGQGELSLHKAAALLGDRSFP